MSGVGAGVLVLVMVLLLLAAAVGVDDDWCLLLRLPIFSDCVFACVSASASAFPAYLCLRTGRAQSLPKAYPLAPSRTLVRKLPPRTLTFPLSPSPNTCPMEWFLVCAAKRAL